MSLGQSLGQKIASNTLISVVGRIASGALGLIAVALISRYLGREGFGEYSIILIFLYIVLAVSDLGLYSILSREISKIENNENKIISSIFGLRILSALLFFVVSFVVLYFLPYSKDIKIGILVASPGFLFLSANQLLMGVFQKHFKTIWPMIGDIIMRGAQLVFVFLFINFKMSLLFFALAISFGALFGFFANMIFARKLVKFSFI
ncbi:MAG: Heteropolysaccharide repeat unit export protein, partial [Parcubacteria group bacterium GW2011_GWE2_37_8]